MLPVSGDPHTGQKHNLIPKLFILFQQPTDSASVTDGVQWLATSRTAGVNWALWFVLTHEF